MASPPSAWTVRRTSARNARGVWTIISHLREVFRRRFLADTLDRSGEGQRGAGGIGSCRDGVDHGLEQCSCSEGMRRVVHHDDLRAGMDRAERASDRFGARPPARNGCSDGLSLPGEGLRNDEHHRAARGGGRLNHAHHERTAAQIRELLETSEPPGIAGGQDDAPDVHEDGSFPTANVGPRRIDRSAGEREECMTFGRMPRGEIPGRDPGGGQGTSPPGFLQSQHIPWSVKQ
jgi:hypothetical protein